MRQCKQRVGNTERKKFDIPYTYIHINLLPRNVLIMAKRAVEWWRAKSDLKRDCESVNCSLLNFSFQILRNEQNSARNSENISH